MDIRFGIKPQDKTHVAHLFWHAFARKIGPLLGPYPKAKSFIAANLNPQAAFCAFDRGELVAAVGFRTAQSGFFGGGFADMAAVYGRVGALWRYALLEAYNQPVEQDEVLLDGLFVDPNWQGQGIGTQLINTLSDHARHLGKSVLVLDVVVENTRAVALYKRHGFVIQNTKKLGPGRWLFKSKAMHRMAKPL